MKKEFRQDIISLKRLYNAFRASESFYADNSEFDAYSAYYSLLQALCSKYHKQPRQIAAAMGY